MDPSDTIFIIVLFALVLLSGFFSSAETAVISVNKIKIRSMIEEHVKNAELVLRLCEDSRKFLNTVLIGNNIVNISASAVVTIYVSTRFGNSYVGMGAGILTFVILIFGEVLPKTLASIYPEKFALAYSPILIFIMKLFIPLVFLLNIISGVLLKILGIDPNDNKTVITENELLTYVEVSHEEGVIENEERNMITNVVGFGDSLAKDVMVTRIDMCTVSDTVNYSELLETFEKDKYSRLPVYHESIDNIIGLVYLKDVAFYKGDKIQFDVTKLIRKPSFTYEFKKTSELLIEMRKASISMCIVLDEYGASVGLITLEDLLEEIVGDIRDEYDTDEVDDIIQINDIEFMVEGNTKLCDFNEYFGTSYDSDDYDSIAGQLIALFERLPEKGDTIEDDGLSYFIESIDHRRIKRVKVKKLEKNPDDANNNADKNET